MPARQAAAIFDLDGTLLRGDSYVQFLLRLLGCYPWRLARCWWLPLAVAAFALRRRDNSWLKRVFWRAIAGGLARNAVARHADDWAAWAVARGRPAVLAALRTHQARGERVIIATASLDCYVTALAARLGVSEIIATRATADDQGLLTGELAGENCYGDEKLRRLLAEFPARADWQITAYSDHHSDLPLLSWADRPIAVCPTPRLADAAITQGWEVWRST